MSKLSRIEKSFKVACSRQGIEFDSQKQVSRYHVDFFDKSRKLIIELDGHEHHKSKEDRTYDAKRDRQLHRDGYTVLRFTGSEIHSNLKQCIEEVKQTLQLIKIQPIPEGAIYIDWQFFDRRAVKCLRYYQNEYANKNLELISLSKFFDFITTYLSLNGRFDVHLFGTASSFSNSLIYLDTMKIWESNNASFSITEHQHEFSAIALINHLHKKGTFYDRLFMVGDDNAYPTLLNKGRKLDILFRRDNDSTSMAEVCAENWQNIDYLIGWCMGLETYEL